MVVDADASKGDTGAELSTTGAELSTVGDGVGNPSLSSPTEILNNAVNADHEFDRVRWYEVSHTKKKRKQRVCRRERR
jgi:hypothetical protein